MRAWKERFMQENLIGTEPLAEITVGRESEEMCLLARFFNGFWRSGAR